MTTRDGLSRKQHAKRRASRLTAETGDPFAWLKVRIERNLLTLITLAARYEMERIPGLPDCGWAQTTRNTIEQLLRSIDRDIATLTEGAS